MSFTDSKSDATYILSISPTSIIFDKVSDQLNFKNIKLPLTTSNIKNLAYLLTCNSSSPRSTTTELKAKYQKARKKLIGHQKKHLSATNDFVEVQNKYKAYQEVENLYTQLDTIKNLPILLNNLNALKDYNGIQIIIHEKGLTTARSLSLLRENEVSESFISVQKFNSIFSLIKKSKHRLFDQSQILRDEIGVVGTFLAKEFELQKHSIILIASRNDFLPATKEEFDSFFSTTQSLASVFEYLLLRDHLNLKNKKINFALENFPFPLRIEEQQNNNILFENKESQRLQSADHPSLETKTINLYNDYDLIIENPQDFNLNTDLFHHQRISLLGELLNTLQHELSNPLFGLKLASDILRSEPLDDENKDLANQIATNVNRCQVIIKNFSNLYKEDDSSENTSLREIIDETIILTKSESRDIKKIVNYSSQEVEEYLININKTWFTQIFFNILINCSQAIKSKQDVSHQEYIKIDVYLDNNFVNFDVYDSGPGVPRDIENRLFDPFFTTKQKGTGLGLSICKSLAKKMNGDISFERQGDISYFKIKLPITTKETIDHDAKKNIIN